MGKTGTNRVKVHGQSYYRLFTIDQHHQRCEFTRFIQHWSGISQKYHVHRMTRLEAELVRENLTFAFALACAAAHAGPKSGSSEEPTYEMRVSPSKRQKNDNHV